MTRHLPLTDKESALLLTALYDAVQYELEFIDCHMVRGKVMKGSVNVVKNTRRMIEGYKRLQAKLHQLRAEGEQP